MNWFTGKGYGVSNLTDFNGRPFLTYQGPNDKVPVTMYDRVAQTFDFTIAQQLTPGAMKNDRFDNSTATAIKKIMGGTSSDELDHKISLELGGSNSPANLWIQPGVVSGASAASDTLENNLALDVANGKISLENAWQILSEQKGFILSEKMIIPTQLNQSVFLSIVKLVFKTQTGLGFSLLQPVSILGINPFTFFSQNQKQVKIGTVNGALKSSLDADIKLLGTQPLNQALMTKIFKEQVDLTAQQLNVSDAEAGRVVQSYLTGYAANKGIDAKGMMGALNINIQKILTNSQGDPNIFGISSVLITKIVAALQTGSVALVGIGITLAVIGIFLAGPTAILGALSGGLLESIGAIFGVSALTGIGLTAFAIGEAFNVAAIGLNMSVKSTYDNGYLLPTQQISALKDALAIQKGLAGFLPSEQKDTGTSSGTGSGSGSGGPTTSNGTSSNTRLFTGVLSSGVLGSSAKFTARTSDLISSISELQDAAQNNLASWLATLPSQLVYEIKEVTSVVDDDGQTRRASTHKVQVGTHKKGTPIFKTYTNKFAVVDVYFNEGNGRRMKLKQIIIGPTDAAKLIASSGQLTQLSGQIGSIVHTTNTDHIDTVVSNTPTNSTTQPPATSSQPQQTITPQAPTTSATAPFIVTFDSASNVYRVRDTRNGSETPFATRDTANQFAAAKNADISAESAPPPTTTPQSGNTAPATTSPVQPLSAAALSAQTLFDFYTAIGKSLPSVANRGVIYNSLGLGSASLYLGTAEQNTNLLNALKANPKLA